MASNFNEIIYETFNYVLGSPQAYINLIVSIMTQIMYVGAPFALAWFWVKKLWYSITNAIQGGGLRI